MARFIVFHGFPPKASQDKLIERAREVVASLAPGAEWLNSWWIPGELEKLICEWEAPNEDAIRTSLEPVKDLFPIEAIHEAQWIDPQWYK
jgi:hypothetical protein